MKINIGVVFGGKSSEHEVSLISASNVMEAMDRTRYDVTPIGITRDGEWHLFNGELSEIADGTWETDREHLISDFSLFHDPLLRAIDIFFPVLHGTFGEDGTIQGLFEMMDKPYVGCGVLASASGMDKEITKMLCRQKGIPVVDDIVLTKGNFSVDKEKYIHSVTERFPFPVFVKPANMGSSVGIAKAHDEKELQTAIEDAFRYDTKVLIEEFIAGTEIETAVLGNENPIASCVGEIVPCNEFYDYDAKYLSGDDSKILIPAPIDPALAEQIRTYAVELFRVIGGSGLSRVDFFADEARGVVYLNEINTMPGFTNISMYPKLWEASGIGYADLITRLIELGFEHHRTRKALLYRKNRRTNRIYHKTGAENRNRQKRAYSR
jgi:D-alanine-D-alanine ligase